MSTMPASCTRGRASLPRRPGIAGSAACLRRATVCLGIGLMFMATVLPPPAAWAVELYKLDGDGPWQLGAASNRLAETFTTGGLRMNLDNVSLRVRNANQDNNHSTAGTLEVWLFSTDGDQKPRDWVHTIATNQFFGTYADETPTYNVSDTLNPYTTYAVVFQPAGRDQRWFVRPADHRRGEHVGHGDVLRRRPVPTSGRRSMPAHSSSATSTSSARAISTSTLRRATRARSATPAARRPSRADRHSTTNTTRRIPRAWPPPPTCWW